MNRLEKLAVGCLACGVAVVSQASQVVYDNLSNPLDAYIGGFPYAEVADDVTLAPGARIFESASVSYYGANFDGDETLTLTLYALDGAPTPGSFGFNTPGTALFTQTVPITATDSGLAVFSDLTGSLLLPDTLAVGLIFNGVDFDPTLVGSDGGPLLYDPPTAGTSFEDYWLRGYPDPADGWGLFTFGGDPVANLGIQITAGIIPEPGTWISMGGVAMLMGMVLVRRFRRA